MPIETRYRQLKVGKIDHRGAAMAGYGWYILEGIRNGNDAVSCADCTCHGPWCLGCNAVQNLTRCWNRSLAEGPEMESQLRALEFNPHIDFKYYREREYLNFVVIMHNAFWNNKRLRNLVADVGNPYLTS